MLNKENISFEQCIQEVEKAQEKLFRLPEIKVDDILLTEIQQHFNNEKDLS